MLLRIERGWYVLGRGKDLGIETRLWDVEDELINRCPVDGQMSISDGDNRGLLSRIATCLPLYDFFLEFPDLVLQFSDSSLLAFDH
jgi:hypothetical protein